MSKVDDIIAQASPLAAAAAKHGTKLLRDVKGFPGDLEVSQETYAGRFRFFLNMTSPRTLLTSSAQLEASKQLLEKVNRREAGWEDVSVAAYQDAQRRVRSILHPETQQPIFLPFRFSAFVPMNFLNLCGMLAPSQQTPARAMFWQFSNQTYNVGFNYCNGSGKDGLPTHELFAGYSVATLTACGLSYGLSKLTSGASSTSNGGGSASQRILRLMIPYTAVACANIANLSVIRFRDVLYGIPVKDPVTGKELCGGEPSVAAGRIAVAQVALSRVLVPIPLMLLPPLWMEYLFNPQKGVKFFVRNRARLHIPVNVATLIAVLVVALPMSVAVFPQNAIVPTSWLEKKFQNQLSAAGNTVKEVTFNKGL